MTHYVVSGPQTYTEGAYALQPGDDLDVLAGASMIGDFSYSFTPLITASGALIDNGGTILSTSSVLRMGAGSTLSNHGTIAEVAAGEIRPTITVYVGTDSEWNYILNDGAISAQSTSGYMSSSITALANLAVVNSGTIVGTISVSGAVLQLANSGSIYVQLPGRYYDNGEPFGNAISAPGGHILNTGTITGYVGVTTGDVYNAGTIRGMVGAHTIENYGTITYSKLAVVDATESNDSLVNDGSITGYVMMRGGDDVVVNNHGTITGTVDLGAGDDAYLATDGTVSVAIIGGIGNDSIAGGLHDDIIYGDNISGDTSGGADMLSGGGGNDVIFGGYGADTLLGNQGNDVLAGNQGDDYIQGGQGDDTLFGGKDSDTLSGGLGDDLLYGGLANDTLVFSANFGHDTVEDFSAIAGDYDMIQFESGTLASYADVQAHLTQEGANVVITYDAADTITLLNTTVATLTADHFLFG